MTQINFYMSRKDEADFLTYVLSRGGYLVRIDEKSGKFYVEDSHCFKFQPFSDQQIYLEPVFGPSNLLDSKRKLKTFHGHSFHGPGIKYQGNRTYDRAIVRARLWYDVTAYSFLPAPPWEGGPPHDYREKFSDQVRAMDNFYKSLCRFIRKRYRHDFGTWHGPDSDLLEASGVPKFQFITEAGPIPQHGFSCDCPKCVDWRPDPAISPFRYWSEATASEQLAIWRDVVAHYEKGTAKPLKCQYKEADYKASLEMIHGIENAFPSLKVARDDASP